MSPIPDIEGHLDVMLTFDYNESGQALLRRSVDVLFECGTCFAVLDNHTEIRTTERGLGFLRRAQLA